MWIISMLPGPQRYGARCRQKTSGHVNGKSVSSVSVNVVFADGHVASHKKRFLRCVYIGDSDSGWFY